MSWDVSLLEVPAAIRRVDDIPEDFDPRTFSRSELTAKILTIFPEADFSDSGWGLIDGNDWSIEVNFGDGEAVSGPMLHVRGGNGAVEAVTKICSALGLRGIDLTTSEFMDAQPDPSQGFKKWSTYRDQIVKAYRPPNLLDRIRGLFRK